MHQREPRWSMFQRQAETATVKKQGPRGRRARLHVTSLPHFDPMQPRMRCIPTPAAKLRHDSAHRQSVMANVPFSMGLLSCQPFYIVVPAPPCLLASVNFLNPCGCHFIPAGPLQSLDKSHPFVTDFALTRHGESASKIWRKEPISGVQRQFRRLVFAPPKPAISRTRSSS